MIASAAQDSGELAAKFEGRGAGDVVGIFQRMIPDNVVAAAAQNREMLAVIFFSILFGYFITQLPEERRERYARWWEDGYEVMIGMTNWVISFTPYGVFALVATTVAETGLAAFAPLAKFFFTVLLGLAIHMFVALPLAMKFFGLPVTRHFRAMAPALLTAFSTASSAAALPLNMECAQKNAGVSKRVSSFTLPLGATINMDGTALYECAVVLFIAQIYGVDLSFGTQVTVVVLSLLTSIGVAGIPAASLVAIVIILDAVGLPKEAIGIVLAVDRVLDMCRTTVNIFGDTCCAVVVAKTEGETPYKTAVPKVTAPSGASV
jgi:Na+/H+-dicarboxylate symporter